MDKDLVRINKVVGISLAVLAVAAVILFFSLSAVISLAIIIASALTFAAFAATLYSYYRISRSAGGLKAYILLIFAAKMVFTAVVFFLVYKFSPYDLIAFIFAFLATFIVFLNIEIFLLYKRMIFGSDKQGT